MPISILTRRVDMRQIEIGYKHRMYVIVRELTAKLEAQGYLTRSETKFLSIAKGMTHGYR